MSENEQGPEMGDMGAVAGEFSESIEGPETGEPFTDDEIRDFMERGPEAPSFHPVLEVWREVLRPAATEATTKVTPQWASRIIQSYPQIQFADMNAVRDSYFGKILQLAKVLDLEIEEDDECLGYTTPEEDVEHNAHHYKNLLLNWQLAFLQWELDWDCTDDHAAVELAAISEVHKMFFGQNGITAFLDNIKFEFTESDSAYLAEALQELKDGQ